MSAIACAKVAAQKRNLVEEEEARSLLIASMIRDVMDGELLPKEVNMRQEERVLMKVPTPLYKSGTEGAICQHCHTPCMQIDAQESCKCCCMKVCAHGHTVSTCTYTRTNACKCTYTYTCTPTTNIHTYICMASCASCVLRLRFWARTLGSANTHTYIHTHTHMHA